MEKFAQRDATIAVAAALPSLGALQHARRGLDPQEIIDELDAGQKGRLLELIAAGNSLPWDDADDELRPLELIHPGYQGNIAMLNNRGWSAALILLSEHAN